MARNGRDRFRGQYVYLLKEREFIQASKNVIKAGGTICMVQRSQQYPQGSLVLGCFRVTNYRDAERSLLAALARSFIPRRDIGREYFEGDERRIAHVFANAVIPFLSSEVSPTIAAVDNKAKMEVTFLRDVLLGLHRACAPDGQTPLHKQLSSELFSDFSAWLARNRQTYDTNENLFGRRMTALCQGNNRIAGISKGRVSQGVVYTMEPDAVLEAMVARQWLDRSDLYRSDQAAERLAPRDESAP